jgi:ppGpp synthetase/RelA/SpoT-type nucleotidyltranferase
MHPTMTRRVSTRATHALGTRLRAPTAISGADIELLQGVLEDAFDALLPVRAELRERMPDIEFTDRVKTVGTLLDKLRRPPFMGLERIREIAGLRIVADMTRVEQDVLAARVKDVLGGRIIDRRSEPRWGYRAVHLEVRRNGMYIEVQVRTVLQDLWAQVVEKLGDTWGRQIRYGGDPPDPDQAVGPNLTRGQLWEVVQQLSDLIEEVESRTADAQRGDSSDEDVLVLNNAESQLRDLLTGLHTALSAGGPV